MIVSKRVMSATYLAEIEMPVAGIVHVIRMWRDDSDHQPAGAQSFWLIESMRPPEGRILVAMIIGPHGRGYPEEMEWCNARVLALDNPGPLSSFGGVNRQCMAAPVPTRAGRADLTDEERRLRRNEASKRCREKKRCAS